MKRLLCSACSLIFLIVATASADEVFIESVIVNDELLCVGSNCGSGEPAIALREGLKINSQVPAILFDDSSTGPSSPKRDWQINANGSLFNTEEAFNLLDIQGGTTPFKVKADSGASALVIAPPGVGLGTALPDANLHLVSNLTPKIRLERTGSPPLGRTYDLLVNSFGFSVADITSNQNPFTIQPDADAFTLYLAQMGRVGLGTSQPAGKLHTRGPGVQLAYFESSDGGPVQVRFRSNSENRRFLAVDNNDAVKSQIIFKDNEILLTGATDSGANRWLSIGPNGIVSRGPTCNSPCDLTFDPDAFTVPSIEDRAAFMWEHMHLPAVGPTSADEPFNLTQKAGGMLHELEVAHIYLEQLNSELKAERARNDAQEKLISSLTERLESLEAR